MPEHPSIIPFLESEDYRTISDIVQAFAQQLRESEDFASSQHSSKLMEYHEMIKDSEFLTKIQEHFDQIYLICKELGILFSIDGRRKSLESLNSKIILHLSKGSSLDLIRDIFAFRIVIFDTADSILSIAKCYEAMQKIILYLSSQGFIPCESIITEEQKKFNAEEYPNIIVPTENLLNIQFADYVKDYIRSPKSNGYQSLHSSFRDSQTSRFFEVQIRLASMHIWAEHYAADHTNYKKKKYSSVSKAWELSKIHVDGFYYIPPRDEFPETYEDLIGLIDPLIIFSRRHSFDS